MSIAEQLTERIQDVMRSASGPIVVALDGRSGAGKSTLAAKVAASTGATVIEGDDFYSGGHAEDWDQMNPAERSAYCIDWRRQRAVLRRLREGQSTTWHAFDWEAFDGRLELGPTTAGPSEVILLEGVYSARPELADLVELSVKLDTPDLERQRNLAHRDGTTLHRDWSQRWNSGEEHYFENVMAEPNFDLVLSDIER